jgi:hypothetical protein
MGLLKSSGQFIFLSFLICCNNKGGPSQQENDTTKLLRTVLKTAFYHGNLPEVEILTEYDSIVITSDSDLLKFIPLSVDNYKFKIVCRGEACRFLKNSTNTNYLDIILIEKEDSAYYVNIQNLNCQEFGGGGSIGIYLLKIIDSFIVKKKGSTSIN